MLDLQKAAVAKRQLDVQLNENKNVKEVSVYQKGIVIIVMYNNILLKAPAATNTLEFNQLSNLHGAECRVNNNACITYLEQ